MFAPLTSVKLQDTALPFLSTWGRRISSFPPWNSTKDGSCLDSGDADTLYLRGGGTASESGWKPLPPLQKHLLLLGNFSVASDVHFPKFEAGAVVPAEQHACHDCVCGGGGSWPSEGGRAYLSERSA